MGKTIYKMCKEVLKPYVGKVLHGGKVRFLIKSEISSTKSKCNEHFKLMEEMGLIREVEEFKYLIVDSDENTEISD